MGRVAFALIWREFFEKIHDRWTLVICMLFALLSCGVILYSKSSSAAIMGPSIVTLVSLLIPLVALMLGYDAIVGERERHTFLLLLSLPIYRYECVLAKFIGRVLALAVATVFGLGIAISLANPEDRYILWNIIFPSILLGASFLSLGILISTLVSRISTAASLLVSTWFLFVFFYDMGILALLVITDGAISQKVVEFLVIINPTGLYRLKMMEKFSGSLLMEDLGMEVALPNNFIIFLLWAGWIIIPLVLSIWLLMRRKVLK